jgi:type II secretory pathway component PulJ
MENSGALVSWMSEAVQNLPASLSDPKSWVTIFAVVLLLVLFSMVSSIRRLNDRLASAFTELSTIRSTLAKMERSLARIEGDRPRADEEGGELQDLLFRMENDRPG